MYTQEFYETVVKRALRPGGIFVTQAGPAGVVACTAVFTVIHNTLAHVFPKVVPYSAAVPSYADAWVCPPVSPPLILLNIYIYLSISLSFYLFGWLGVCVSTCLSVTYVSSYSSVYPSLSICPSVYEHSFIKKRLIGPAGHVPTHG